MTNVKVHNKASFSCNDIINAVLNMYTESFDKFREMNYREREGGATSIIDACKVWLSVLSSKNLEPYKDKVE